LKRGFTSDCPFQGVPLKSRSVITVESDGANPVAVTSTTGTRSMKEVLVAEQIEDCSQR
jgi:hypothetical protein